MDARSPCRSSKSRRCRLFKFNITQESIARAEAGIRREFNKVVSDPALMTEVGETMTDRIRYQARVRKPLNDSATLPPLKPVTIANRKELAKYNATDATFSANRSNLTLTGAFLNSLGFEITGPGRLSIQFIGQHPGYKLKGGSTTRGPQNKDLYGYLKDKGFIALTVKGVDGYQVLKKRINTIVSGYIRRSFRSR